MKSKIILTLIIGVIGILSGILLVQCGKRNFKSESVRESKQEKTTQQSGYYEISVKQLKTELNKKNFLLVNVHIPYAGELPGTDLFIPFDKLTKNLDKLPGQKDAKIVLYCRSGHMSAIAAKTLAQSGYTNVYDVPGGMKAWVTEGYELIHK